MFYPSNKRILVLAPHTDDAEFGCGGSIVRFLREGCQVFCCAFSAAEESVPNNLPTDINRTAMFRSMEFLGIPRENTRILDYKVRRFPEFRQEILEDLVKLNKEIEPDIVFLPSPYDTHQDHQTLSQEGFRAFKRNTLLGYELPWNNLTFTTNCFVKIDEEELIKKISSLEFYISQFNRDYLDEGFIRSWARTRGGQMGHKYAEAFQIIRLLI